MAEKHSRREAEEVSGRCGAANTYSTNLVKFRYWETQAVQLCYTLQGVLLFNRDFTTFKLLLRLLTGNVNSLKKAVWNLFSELVVEFKNYLSDGNQSFAICTMDPSC